MRNGTRDFQENEIAMCRLIRLKPAECHRSRDLLNFFGAGDVHSCGDPKGDDRFVTKAADAIFGDVQMKGTDSLLHEPGQNLTWDERQ